MASVCHWVADEFLVGVWQLRRFSKDAVDEVAKSGGGAFGVGGAGASPGADHGGGVVGVSVVVALDPGGDRPPAAVEVD